MEFEEYEEDSIPFMRIFRYAFYNKIRFLIITVCVAILCFLSIVLGYNRNKQVYVSSYEWSISCLNEGKYIDGSTFKFKELVSKDTIEQIKNSDPIFNGVDVDGMYKNDGIDIVKIVSMNTTTGETRTIFTLTVQKKYFPSEEVARKFVEAIINIPVDKTLLLLGVVDYSSTLKLSDGTKVLDTKISYLQEQYSYLYNKYQYLLDNYGDVVLENGTKVSEHLASLTIYFNNNSLEALQYEVKQNGYISQDTSYSNRLKLQKEELRRTYNLNSKKIDELLTQRNALIASANGTLENVQLDSYNSKIIHLTTENIDITEEYNVINRKLKLNDPIAVGLDDPNAVVDSPEYASNLTAFENKIKTHTQKLYEFTDDYESVEKYVESLNATVSYSTNKIIEKSGGISKIVAAAGSLFAGFVIAFIFNVIYDWNREEKNKVPNEKNEEKDEEAE